MPAVMDWCNAHAGGPRAVHPVCSLHVLERLLHVMSYTPFVDLLVSLLCPNPHTNTDTAVPSASAQASDAATDRASSGSFASTSRSDSHSDRHQSPPTRHKTEAAAAAEGPEGRSLQQPSPWQALFALHEHSLAYRDCFLAILHGKDSQLTAAAVRALVAVVQSKAVSDHVLSAAGQYLPPSA